MVEMAIKNMTNDDWRSRVDKDWNNDEEEGEGRGTAMMKASVAADTATDAKNKRRPFMMNGKRHLERITVQETPIPPPSSTCTRAAILCRNLFQTSLPCIRNIITVQ